MVFNAVGSILVIVAAIVLQVLFIDDKQSTQIVFDWQASEPSQD